ncbi:MAG: YraN family protein [Actinomycetota bacterium]|nr:YraN family protein [Actinomycetota bacterium]MDH5223612.1 YraN family protein [Actinomycetota bacterium]MDH5313613.1 YraN family protein [Actinomycetota bacterium]
MSETRSELCARGERAALELYRRRGFALVARNWRCSIGEIDLVLKRGQVLVFCEVKTRRGSRHGGGFEAVDARKQRKLRALAEVYLLTHEATQTSVRFDVASVTTATGPGHPGSLQVELFEEAF